MPDRDQLQAAVQWWDDNRGFVWQQATNPEWAHLDRLAAAAQAWLEFPTPDQIWWCETHEASSLTDGSCVVWQEQDLFPPATCRMVEALLSVKETSE